MTNEEFTDFMNRHLQPCNVTLNSRVIAMDQDVGRAIMTFEAKPEFCHSRNTIVQGGFLCAMIDSVMTHALIAAAGLNVRVPSLELKVSFLAATGPGLICGEGQVMRRGRSIAFLEGSLFDENKKTLLVRASSTSKLSLKQSS